jgi:hypothetical protein
VSAYPSALSALSTLMDAQALAQPIAMLPATQPDVLKAICALEQISLERCEQVDIPTDQLLHGGMYARTIEMPPGIVLTGALMKRATVLIVCGRARMLAGCQWVELDGYNVLPACAGRKQVFESIERTWITMLFPTGVSSAEEAEAEFTDDCERLSSRHSAQNTVRETGV